MKQIHNLITFSLILLSTTAFSQDTTIKGVIKTSDGQPSENVSVGIKGGQIPDFSKVPMLHEGDSVGIVNLLNQGIKVSDGKVDCWFPKDSLTMDAMLDIVKKINIGVLGSEKLIGAPLAWQVHQPNEKYTFYFRLDNFVSHASFYNYVSIPFWRIKEDKAPWLHEVIHEMLNSKNGKWFPPEKTKAERMKSQPLWLFEGLPDYISLYVSNQYNLKWYDVFSNSYQSINGVDSLFIEDLKSDKTTYVLSFIGAQGVMPELFSNDRQKYAPIFYHGACSFVKFLSKKYGIHILVTAISSFDKEQKTIEDLTGKSMDNLKKEWMDSLK